MRGGISGTGLSEAELVAVAMVSSWLSGPRCRIIAAGARAPQATHRLHESELLSVQATQLHAGPAAPVTESSAGSEGAWFGHVDSAGAASERRER
jgi:hypothetical protein